MIQSGLFSAQYALKLTYEHVARQICRLAIARQESRKTELRGGNGVGRIERGRERDERSGGNLRPPSFQIDRIDPTEPKLGILEQNVTISMILQSIIHFRYFLLTL